MKLFAAYTLGGPNSHENVIGKPRRAGGSEGEAFLEIGNANGSYHNLLKWYVVNDG